MTQGHWHPQSEAQDGTATEHMRDMYFFDNAGETQFVGNARAMVVYYTAWLRWPRQEQLQYAD